LPKWKQDATEFTVSINYNENRGFQSSIPKPIIDFLQLVPNDKLDWTMKEGKDGERVVIVSKFDDYEKAKKIIKKHKREN
jgi:hypothetical protein